MTEKQLPKTLLSVVGMTDPIGNRHDGAIMHLARHLRPEKIVLIFSEQMAEREERMRKALASIAEYQPKIITHDSYIEDDEIYRFDAMFDTMEKIIDIYHPDNELILNLSSATPQVIGAMYAINRIKNYNIRAYQVKTPKKGANHRRDEEPIDDIIESNLDQHPEAENRIISEKGQKFTRSLIIRNLKEVLDNYDYQAFYNLLKISDLSHLDEETRDRLEKNAENLSNVFRYHKPLDADLMNKVGEDWDGLSDKQANSLRYLLMVDILRRREMLADVLIKMKSLAEYMLEEYIEKLLPNLLEFRDGKPYINQSHDRADELFQVLEADFRESLGDKYDSERPYNKDSIVGFPSYRIIVNYIKPDETDLIDALKVIKKYNRPRNTVAHGLSELSRKQMKESKLDRIIDSLSTIYKFVYDTDYLPLDLYDRINAKLIEELN